MLDSIPVQDKDLLGRLSLYLEKLDENLEGGLGWVIFNADRQRAARATKFLFDGIRRSKHAANAYFMLWRDFTMNAYMLRVEMKSPIGIFQGHDSDPRRMREYGIATRVSFETYRQMQEQPLLIISGLSPAYQHEVEHLEEVINDRCNHKQATILITPRDVEGLAKEFKAAAPSADHWPRFFGRMYATSLIAV